MCNLYFFFHLHIKFWDNTLCLYIEKPSSLRWEVALMLPWGCRQRKSPWANEMPFIWFAADESWCLSQTPGDACTGAREAGTEVWEDVWPVPCLSCPTLSWTSPLNLPLASGSSSASKIPGKQLENGLFSAHTRLLHFQSSFKGHRKIHGCTYTPIIC